MFSKYDMPWSWVITVTRYIRKIYSEDNEILNKKDGHKLSSLNTAGNTTASDKPKMKGFCHHFNRDGKCSRRGCQYIHEKDPDYKASNHEKKTPLPTKSEIKPVDENNRSFKPFAKSPAQFKVMTEKVGLPRGMKTDVNKDGWSKAQQADLKIMIGEYESEVKQVLFKSFRVEKRKFNAKTSDLSEANDTDESQLDNELFQYNVHRRALTATTADDNIESESQLNIENAKIVKTDSDPWSTSEPVSRIATYQTDDTNDHSHIVDDNQTENSLSSDQQSVHIPKRVVENPSESLSDRLRPQPERQRVNQNASQTNIAYNQEDDSNFNSWNYDKFSTKLTSFENCLRDRSLNSNRQIISALHHIYDYYRNTDYIEKYDREDKMLSIHPRTFMYCNRGHDPDGVWTYSLFGYDYLTSEYDNHKRQDIVNTKTEFFKMIYGAASIAWGAINITDETIFSFNAPNFSVEYYNAPIRQKPGYYFSMFTQVVDYAYVLSQIQAMNSKSDEQTNEVIIDTLELALVFDFMAFVSQSLGAFPFSTTRVAYTRHLLMQDCDSITNINYINSDYKGIFKQIILNTHPTYDNVNPFSLHSQIRFNIYNYFAHRDIQPSRKTHDNLLKSCKVTTFYSYSLTSHSVKSLRNQPRRFIMDTGASVSATSDKLLLQNVRPCSNMIAYAAFGHQIEPTLRGDFSKLGLDTLFIDDMPDTLLSVSQICAGGSTNKKNVAIFTAEGSRIFEMDSIKTALQMIHSDGVEIMRGLLSDGIYITQKSELMKTNRIYLAQFKPESTYYHIHMVTGHPGEKAMKWHKQNSTNAQYSDHDENRDRGICKGCVYGSLHQTTTDHLKVHREIPLIPGQCFCLDAHTHSIKSSRGNLYCDLFTDLATRRNYPVFTKSRAAEELCKRCNELFQKHPEWQNNSSKTQMRFIRLDSESNYKSKEFLEFVSKIGYILERTPVQDKHANGVAERSVGVISVKTNIAMMSPEPHVPQMFWDYAMEYACDTQSFNYSSVIGTSPYMKIIGQPINIKYLQPFWSSCYVFIPVKERNKVGDPRAYKAHFVGYSYSTLLFPNYIVIPVTNKNKYLKERISKNVIFDPTINFSIYTKNEEPYDREFETPDHYIPFNNRKNAPTDMQGPHAVPDMVIENETHVIQKPKRTVDVPTNDNINDIVPSTDSLPAISEDNINKYHLPYNHDDGTPVYWYNLFVQNYEYPLIMCETQNFYKMKVARDPNVPENFYKAMKIPQWAIAINKELEKFAKNLCLQLVPYNNQHLVPMMWTFVIKTDGTLKARLVGRGDLMLPYVDFDPNKVYCGNVTACSIKMCMTIAAKYKLEMRGGDLEGAYLVTRANPDYPVYIKTPQGYSIPQDMCIQAIGNLYGFPPAGQNFSIEFDKCVSECGYINTPWDLKFFYKWINSMPLLLIVHSDDFRWFGNKEHLSEWQLLVDTFEKHKYKVTDVSDNEFVGIRITHDEHYNYFMDQTRMIEDIITEAHMKNAKDEELPYPLHGEKLSKQDNATAENEAECRKFPYRRVIGQLMYGMVHTLVTISYALNVLSRYSNNPGPRHIVFAKHLLKYVRTTKLNRLKFGTHEGEKDIETMTKVLQLRFQCDADLAGNPDTKHSQTSYLGYLGGSLICWCSTD